MRKFRITLVTTITLLFGMTACSPVEAYVKADEATLKFVGKDWSDYFRADTSLTPMQKDLREDVLSSWADRVEAAKK